MQLAKNRRLRGRPATRRPSLHLIGRGSRGFEAPRGTETLRHVFRRPGIFLAEICPHCGSTQSQLITETVAWARDSECRSGVMWAPD
eukprot:s2199_g3.t1